MKPDEVRRLYDRSYAAEYDEKFMTSSLSWPDVRHELELLRGLLEPADSWLDVACATGFYMRWFPQARRTGFDIAPAMVEIARSSNPGAKVIEANFLDERTDWIGKFDLVSCMWYAYCLVDTIAELLRLIENLSTWTSSGGRCFLPLADPELIAGQALPYRLSSGGWPGAVTLDGILWSYSEHDGEKVHSNLVAPHPDFMVESFEKYFEDVTLIRYPPAFPGWTGRPAIVARKKRVTA